MNWRSLWHWWRSLAQNPIYLREKGSWGKPNPFYDNLSRFSPFIIMGAIIFGLCAGSGNPVLFSGIDEAMIFWCLLCLPGALLSMLTLFGSLMAPALTAPSISMEVDRGTWDILRMTPQSTPSILLAKLFGALARLRIWPALFALSLLQGLMLTCTISVFGGETAAWGAWSGIATILRPWLEILFAAFAGMYLSTWVRSATMALAGTYAGVVAFKVFNSSSLWLVILGVLGLSETTLFLGGTVGPAAVYALATAALWLGLVHRARELSYS